MENISILQYSIDNILHFLSVYYKSHFICKFPLPWSFAELWKQSGIHELWKLQFLFARWTICCSRDRVRDFYWQLLIHPVQPITTQHSSMKYQITTECLHSILLKTLQVEWFCAGIKGCSMWLDSFDSRSKFHFSKVQIWH